MKVTKKEIASSILLAAFMFAVGFFAHARLISHGLNVVDKGVVGIIKSEVEFKALRSDIINNNKSAFIALVNEYPFLTDLIYQNEPSIIASMESWQMLDAGISFIRSPIKCYTSWSLFGGASPIADNSLVDCPLIERRSD